MIILAALHDDDAPDMEKPRKDKDLRHQPRVNRKVLLTLAQKHNAGVRDAQEHDV